MANFSDFVSAASAPEGTAVISTGVSVGWVLQADGDNTSSWVALAGGGDALTSNPLSQFAATTSLQLLNTISDETGTGALVFATSPTFVTPILGTPTSGVATNLTGTASGLTAGAVTTNANLTGEITSVGNTASLGSFTVASLNTAISDASVATGGGTATGSNTGDQTNITGSAGTVTSIGDLTGHITSTNRATLLGSFTIAQLNTALSDAKLGEEIIIGIAFGDETTAITTGTAKATFHMPDFATTLTDVAVGLTTAGTGSVITVDLNEAGVSVLSTKVTVDATEKHSSDATTAPVISDSALAANALMSVDLDAVDSGGVGAGPKIYLTVKRA